MAVYKFKIFLEDNEDIYREIEILSGQTFEDFHHIIQDSVGFDRKHAASFFVSDDYWRKEQEITLRKEDLELDQEEIKKNVAPKKLMLSTKIAKYIDNPRQRFLYVFDPNVKWTFCIELMKILEEKAKVKYPICSKTIGTSPKQYKQTAMAREALTTDQLIESMLNEPEINDESEIYKAIKNDTNAIDEGDLNHLEAEEGEDSEEINDDFENEEDNDEDIEIPEDYENEKD
ncbi:MAG: IS1096 element passenger TnpR family protein [Bacteroidota bacterium]